MDIDDSMTDNSEYIADCDARRAYISGFTGSAGRAAVTDTEALLWTDGRYFLQAEKQLDSSCWKLMKAGEKGVPNLSAWLVEKYGFDEVTRVGIDPRVVTYEVAKATRDSLKEKEGKRESNRELVAVQENLIDEIWSGDKAADGQGGKPARPTSEVFILEEKYTGALFCVHPNLYAHARIQDAALAISSSSSGVPCRRPTPQASWLVCSMKSRGSSICADPTSSTTL